MKFTNPIKQLNEIENRLKMLEKSVTEIDNGCHNAVSSLRDDVVKATEICVQGTGDVTSLIAQVERRVSAMENNRNDNEFLSSEFDYTDYQGFEKIESSRQTNRRIALLAAGAYISGIASSGIIYMIILNMG